jgi:pyruvate dehydrogenase E1 component alpha subunit
MHFFDAERHMLGGNGIVGAQIPIATGVALKCRYRKDGGVVLCWFGDGAIHQGSFHESLNMAKIWKLPIIYICENNQYGMGTDFRRVSSVTDFVVMGDSYGIPGMQVNGMDVLDVYRDVTEAAARVRAESTTLFLEIKTYRYRGHSMSDPAKYRTPEELESYKKQDPILILKSHMEESGRLTAEQYAAMDAEYKTLCDEAVRFAEESPEPDPSALYEDILA